MREGVRENDIKDPWRVVTAGVSFRVPGAGRDTWHDEEVVGGSGWQRIQKRGHQSTTGLSGLLPPCANAVRAPMAPWARSLEGTSARDISRWCAADSGWRDDHDRAGRATAQGGGLWAPVAGDRFVVPDRNMDNDVFVVSDMTIEVGDYQGSKMIGFNGATEWALDSIEQREVIWLPREEQLRALLGDTFRTLTAVPGAGYRVELTDTTHTAEDAEQAYADAVIHLLGT